MSRRRVVLYLLAGALAYGLVLVATVPAAWIAQILERATGQVLLVRAPTGTLWSGSARLYAAARSGPPLPLGELRWRSRWSGLLAAKLIAAITLGSSARATDIELSFRGVSVQNLDVEVPGQALASFVPGLEGFGPQGVLRLRSNRLQLDEGSVLGLAEVEWRGVRLARMPGLDLGSHIARVRGGGSRVDVELGTLEGPLQLSGKGTWQPGSGFSMTGALNHGAQVSPELVQFLNGMCTEYRAGRCGFRVGL